MGASTSHYFTGYYGLLVERLYLPSFVLSTSLLCKKAHCLNVPFVISLTTTQLMCPRLHLHSTSNVLPICPHIDGCTNVLERIQMGPFVNLLGRKELTEQVIGAQLLELCYVGP
jgi:hypothetical protein